MLLFMSRNMEKNQQSLKYCYNVHSTFYAKTIQKGYKKAKKLFGKNNSLLNMIFVVKSRFCAIIILFC